LLSENISTVTDKTRIPIRPFTGREQSPDWRRKRPQLLSNRHTFTGDQERRIEDYVPDHFLSRHVPLTIPISQSVILITHRQIQDSEQTNQCSPEVDSNATVPSFAALPGVGTHHIVGFASHNGDKSKQAKLSRVRQPPIGVAIILAR
jgi:hypothetical protein